MNKYKIEIKWGIIFVVMTLVWIAMEKALGLHSTHIEHHATYTNFIAIPAIVIYVLALLEKRKKDFGGTMSYKQGFISGLIITLVVTILSPLSQVLISSVISPDYFSNMIEYTSENGIMDREAAEAWFNLKSYIV
ncbi:MAG: DUF4199 domain-containing protein, partial [Balneolaceae bacterium]